jgi:prophage regulatory protein
MEILVTAKKIIIRLPVVINRTGLKRSTIYALIAEGRFPKQIKLGTKASGWLESEVDQWIESRIEASK